MIIYKNKKYLNLRKLCLHLGRNYKKTHARIKSGKSLEVALTRDSLKKTGQSIEVNMKNGKNFSSRTEFAKHFKKSPKTISDRLNRGFSPEQAVDLEEYAIKNRIVTIVDGKEFRSRRKAAQYIGIAPELVGTRLRRGFDLDKALSKENLPRKSGNEIIFDNYCFENLTNACKYFDVSFGIARYRIKNNWTLPQTFNLEKPPPNTSKSAPKDIFYKKKFYKSISEFADAFGQNYSLVSSRLRAGYSFAQAIGDEEIKYDGKPQKLEIKGLFFQSIAEAANHFGVNYGTVSSRKKKGWSMEQALELAPRPEGSTTMYGVIYMINHSKLNKLYIGASRQNPFKRFEQHKKKQKKSLKNSIQEAMSKNPHKDFEFFILERANSKGELEEIERKYIKQYNSLYPHGYNLSSGGALGPLPGIKIELKSGEKFDSLAAACRHFQQNYGRAKYRYDKGYPIEQVLNIEPIKFFNHPSKSKPIKIKGRNFKTIKDAAEFYNIKVSTVRNRVHTGWKIKDAILIPTMNKK